MSVFTDSIVFNTGCVSQNVSFKYTAHILTFPQMNPGRIAHELQPNKLYIFGEFDSQIFLEIPTVSVSQPNIFNSVCIEPRVQYQSVYGLVDQDMIQCFVCAISAINTILAPLCRIDYPRTVTRSNVHKYIIFVALLCPNVQMGTSKVRWPSLWICIPIEIRL